MSEHGPLDGPCDCGCHDHRDTMHFMPCCDYTYQPRAQAEAAAKKLRETSGEQAGSTSPLATFEGTYLGFSPTDESAVVMGEMEIVISHENIAVRMATGLKIETDTTNPADFISMTSEEVQAEFNSRSAIVDRTVGFRTENGHPKLLFLKDAADDELGLIVRTGGMGEMLGPTVLFSPDQVARGDFDKAVSEIEKNAGKGVLPRLRNNGKAEK